MTGTADPLLNVERAYRDAAAVAQRLYEEIDTASDREAAGDTYEFAADREEQLEEQLTGTPAVSLAGCAVKLRWLRQSLVDAGLRGGNLAAVDTVLAFIDRQSTSA